MTLISRASPSCRVLTDVTRCTIRRSGVCGLAKNAEASRMKETCVSFSSSSRCSAKISQVLHLDNAGIGIRRGRRSIVAASPPMEDAVVVTEPLTKEDLVGYLASGCKPKEKWRIGTEHEKFGFEFGTLRPMKYEQIAELLNSIAERFDWEKVMEADYIIGLKQGKQSISLEPGGQFELSGAPLETLHQTCAEVNSHLYQVKAVAEEMGIGFLGIGFQPKWGLKDIPVMPKGRYEIMRNYMPKVGSLGLDMMFRTCTVQVNLDFSSEADMIRKFRAGLALQPIATALFANSPFTEGKPNGYLSMRSHIWTDTDNNRAGMLPFVFDDSFGFEQYVDYALDVPMYFVYRKKKYIDCTGMSFRDFLAGKLPCLPGELPTLNDWENHLTTIFPEVRLKRYLEMRGADGGPWRRLCALPAFWVGLLYDEDSLQNVLDMTADWTTGERQMLRRGGKSIFPRTQLSPRQITDMRRSLSSSLVVGAIFALLLREISAVKTAVSNLRRRSPADGTRSLCSHLIRPNGYPCTEHTVQTKDGYLLALQRVSSRNGNLRVQCGPPVLLVHGLFMGGDAWFLDSTEESLGFILADHGFDVWVANVRGTHWSHGHVTLSEKSKGFWDWSWQDLALYDLAEMICFINLKTSSKIFLVGHSQGTIVSLAALTQPDVVEMVEAAALLSPISYLDHITAPLVRRMVSMHLDQMVLALGIHQLNFRSNVLIDLIDSLCDGHLDCNDLLTAITGKNCCFNNSRVDFYLENEPHPSSAKNIHHLFQMIRQGTFSQYDYGFFKNLRLYGQTKPPAFDLTRIPKSLPLWMSYGGNDALADVIDVQHTLNELQSTPELVYLENYGHMDFILSINGKEDHYNSMIGFFRSLGKSSSS